MMMMKSYMIETKLQWINVQSVEWCRCRLPYATWIVKVTLFNVTVHGYYRPLIESDMWPIKLRHPQGHITYFCLKISEASFVVYDRTSTGALTKDNFADDHECPMPQVLFKRFHCISKLQHRHCEWEIRTVLFSL